MLVSKSRSQNRSSRFTNTTIMRIGSFGLAVAVLLFVGIFLHLANASGASSPEAKLPAGVTATGDTASDEAPGPESPANPVVDKPADSSLPNSSNVRGAVLSGNSLVYKVDKSAGEREPIILTLFADDSDGDKLYYSVSNMPDGASFDPDTLTFSWTPRYNQAGTHTIRFEVSDGQANDYEDVTIDVIQYGENWDVNVDGQANVLDIVLVGQHWNETGLNAWIKEDTNEDGEVNVLDMIVVGQHWTG
jgi:Putative Ig domain/Dockerin type I domain